MRAWTLPENIEDLLPADAKKLERLRRAALDLFASHGFELVMPPLLEYVESLLSGTGHDMDLATFKLVDQLSGRTMGIRADTTPQVARIDAHLLNRQGVTRLCYAGSVLHTLPSGLGKSRQPFQAGAEMYGHAGLEADIEIQQLMVDVLHALGVVDVQLDIGHPAIFRSLIASAGVSPDIAEQAFIATEVKDVAALKALETTLGKAYSAIAALPTLYGDASVLMRAADCLPKNRNIVEALSQLVAIAEHFSQQGIKVSVDLGELGGFNYESGITFAAFARGVPDAIARGGRYDEVGKAFGRARPATGFSMDLKALLPLVADEPIRGAILAPQQADAAAKAEITRLRASGETVIAALSGHEAHLHELGCDRKLSLVNGRWTTVPFT
ncbi:MAG: ATP phosphoribosyltransferase regulatory subunit [Burkholderiales bacterium]|nr:ATP phosphoribosyltransferase regulatory subunit [Burkholderiales bacterium]